MKIEKSKLFNHINDGYATLYASGYKTIGSNMSDEILELPDDYFQKLDSNRVPTLSKNYLLCFSRKGYEALKEEIKTIFLNCEKKRYGGNAEEEWKHFEKEAERHFKTVETRHANKIKLLEKKLAELKSL